MQLKRSELRIKIMTILYQIDMYKQNKMEYNVDDVIKENLEIDNEFVKEIVYGVNTYYNELNEIANKYLADWKIDRLNKTQYDPLAKKLRYLLKNDRELLDTMVIYSTETPTEYKGKVGSISYVPSVAGLLLTSYVINTFLDK